MKTIKVAVIGMFHYEYFFIPYWQKYYGDLFGYENLYAIGDIANDPSFKLLHNKVNLINYQPKHILDHDEHCWLIRKIQTELLQTHEVVIFAEADQFFVPDPNKYLNLNDYLYQNNNDYIKVSGWNVLHDIINEPMYLPTTKLLHNRSCWFKDPGPEDKLAIVRKPMEWYSVGFHQSRPDVEPDKGLYNIHFHLFDFHQCNCRRLIRTSTPNWHPNSGKHRNGGHVFVQDQELENKWFDYGLSCGISLIPEKFKESL